MVIYLYTINKSRAKGKKEALSKRIIRSTVCGLISKYPVKNGKVNRLVI